MSQIEQDGAKVIEFRNPLHPWPDDPPIPSLGPLEDDDDIEEEYSRGARPTSEDIEEENVLMLRRQCLFRWAAHAVAIAASQLPEVQKIVAFGSVVPPLEMEVPRFPQFRRHGIEVLHECADLDLAVWSTDLSELNKLRRLMSRALPAVQDTPYGGVAHHQLDVHIFDHARGAYRGRLCSFSECPKPGKRECRVPGCGSQPFLRQFEKYRFRPALFEAAEKVVLLDRAANFLVQMPPIR